MDLDFIMGAAFGGFLGGFLTHLRAKRADRREREQRPARGAAQLAKDPVVNALAGNCVVGHNDYCYTHKTNRVH